MSKHSLISTGLGLGLMAASMGASAQLHSFDGGMMYFGATSGGNKYVAFVPQMSRAAGGGAAGVLMLEMFQPATGTASSWAYAIGGSVGDAAGGTGSTATVGSTWTANNGITYSGTWYFGDNIALTHQFSNEATVSSQVCNVSFVASLGTQDQLFFTNVTVVPDDWNSATAVVSITTSTAASHTMSVAQAAWNNASATLATFGFSGASISGIATSVSGSANVNNLLGARNKCVTAYTGRTGGTTATIVGSPPGLIRLW